MRRTTDIELMRLLHGELPADQARGLRARMEREPELAAAYARLERTWTGLELPPAAAAPPGFGQRILAQARPEGPGGALSWSAAPVWVRATAAAALVFGLVVGAGVGSWTGPPAALDVESVGSDGSDGSEEIEPSFAEAYWDALGELDEVGL